MNRFFKDISNSIKELKWYEWIMTAVMIFIAGISVYDGFTNSNSYNPGWLTIINFISAICGIFCVFLTAKAAISNFLFAVINTFVYIIFLAYHRNDGFTGTLILECVIYAPMNIISWIYWAKHRDSIEQHKTKSKKLSVIQCIIFTSLIVAVALLMYYSLNKYINPKASTIFDSFIFAIGIVAIVLELLRYREQYVLWIITDIIAVIQYIHKFDAVYLTKKTIYLIVAIIGIINWVKLNRERNKGNL